MIKIAFVIDTIESPTAGTEKQLLLLIRKLDKQKFKPFLCVLKSSLWLEQEFTDCERFTVNFSSFGKISCYFNLLNFSRWLRKNEVDIVQTFFNDGNKVGILAARIAGVKVVVSTRRNQGYWHGSLTLFGLKFFNFFTNHFLVNSEKTKQWLQGTQKISDEKITVIHNAIEHELYYRATKAQKLAFRQYLGVAEQSILVGIVANLRPVKAIDVFIKSAQLVRKEVSQAVFVIVGDGSERNALESMCRDLGVSNCVCFLGKRLDIPDILSCIDVGVLSSSSESFSNSIIEYMASGLPVVCTDVGGALEAIDNGMNGFIVEKNDHEEMASKIIESIYYMSPKEVAIFNNNKIEDMFSIDIIINKYIYFFNKLQSGPPAKPVA